MPAKKFRKCQKIISSGVSTSTSISFGSYGLVALDGFRFSEKALEATRKVITRYIKPHGGVLYVKMMHKMPRTEKPLSVRMGSGKGAVSEYVYNVKKFMVMFEIDGIPDNIAQKAFLMAFSKIPAKCTIVKKKFINNN
ncbi:50S ribosomal protein L16 [Candidatus Deianiraea vastatrix]|uniref:50S ribosomal protein L16 n=1 Tax=Candidatus Deianiraea vastatrix TaxID=2163644 RepID=A0A5B8XE89_9RICK|nr:50S ribosomal protein L16 [Candidatus Deianiraea vastatrix]QED23195.1 50S ribosomal protein L16 [Candidatus Deianiraea vastatrix]